MIDPPAGGPRNPGKGPGRRSRSAPVPENVATTPGRHAETLTAPPVVEPCQSVLPPSGEQRPRRTPRSSRLKATASSGPAQNGAGSAAGPLEPHPAPQGALQTSPRLPSTRTPRRQVSEGSDQHSPRHAEAKPAAKKKAVKKKKLQGLSVTTKVHAFSFTTDNRKTRRSVRTIALTAGLDDESAPRPIGLKPRPKYAPLPLRDPGTDSGHPSRTGSSASADHGDATTTLETGGHVGGNSAIIGDVQATRQTAALSDLQSGPFFSSDVHSSLHRLERPTPFIMTGVAAGDSMYSPSPMLAGPLQARGSPGSISQWQVPRSRGDLNPSPPLSPRPLVFRSRMTKGPAPAEAAEERDRHVSFCSNSEVVQFQVEPDSSPHSPRQLFNGSPFGSNNPVAPATSTARPPAFAGGGAVGQLSVVSWDNWWRGRGAPPPPATSSTTSSNKVTSLAHSAKSGGRDIAAGNFMSVLAS